MKGAPRRLIKATITLLVIAIIFITSAAWFYLHPPQKIPSNIKVDKILVEKSARRLHVQSAGKTIVSYPISLGGRPKGDKQCEGDNKTPEGEYILDWRNPDSVAYKSLHISYPNEDDRREAVELGCSPGGSIMIHGIAGGWGWIGRFHRFDDWTQGCVAVTNEEMEQLWWAVEDGTPIEIKP